MSREFKAKNIWEEVDHSLIMDYGKRYMEFLDKAKTERLAVKEVVRQSKKHGFVDYNDIMKKGKYQSRRQDNIQSQGQICRTFCSW